MAKLVASDALAGVRLGRSVSVDEEIVVAESEETNGEGAVYLFERSAGGRGDGVEAARLLLPPGTVGGDLGRSVSVSGKAVVAGGADHR